MDISLGVDRLPSADDTSYTKCSKCLPLRFWGLVVEDEPSELTSMCVQVQSQPFVIDIPHLYCVCNLSSKILKARL